MAHWKFATPADAEKSSKVIFKMFNEYLAQDDFVGADMARKFIQMGYSPARSYANYRGGRKYDKEKDYALNERGTDDLQKNRSAAIFYEVWKKLRRMRLMRN